MKMLQVVQFLAGVLIGFFLVKYLVVPSLMRQKESYTIVVSDGMGRTWTQYDCSPPCVFTVHAVGECGTLTVTMDRTPKNPLVTSPLRP